MAGNLIAITGASGQVGSRTATRLADRGADLRLVVRDPSRAPDLPAAEVRQASAYGSADEMRVAFEGADTVFLIPAEESADRVQQHLTAVDAAAAAGVGQIVYLSFLNASPDAVFTLVRHHWATEQGVRKTGVPFTFLRMSMYMDFIPSMVSPEGVLAGPVRDGRVSAVLRDDMADVAAAVLLDPEPHRGEIYDVTGREAFTFAEAAAEMSRASGKRIEFKDETLDEAWESRRQFGAPDWEVEGWISSYLGVAAGEVEAVSDTVARLAGHEPVTLAEYLRAHPESLDHVS